MTPIRNTPPSFGVISGGSASSPADGTGRSAPAAGDWKTGLPGAPTTEGLASLHPATLATAQTAIEQMGAAWQPRTDARPQRQATGKHAPSPLVARTLADVSGALQQPRNLDASSALDVVSASAGALQDIWQG